MPGIWKMFSLAFSAKKSDVSIHPPPLEYLLTTYPVSPVHPWAALEIALSLSLYGIGGLAGLNSEAPKPGSVSCSHAALIHEPLGGFPFPRTFKIFFYTGIPHM